MLYGFLHELEELHDILDTLVFEDVPSFFTDEYANELVETALHLMDEYIYEHPQIISEPDFREILLDEIKDLFYLQLEDAFQDFDEDMDEILEDAFQIFVTLFYPERSCIQDTNEDDSEDGEDGYEDGDGDGEDQEDQEDEDEDEENQEKNKKIKLLEAKIQGLRDIPQPIQRTPEWYLFRSNLITASNAWKAFESQAAINQLIYEKCKPMKPVEEQTDVKIINSVNTNTAMHHGQKYEPVSVMLYESIYKTKVEDFGCIQHPIYKFIGASPDGIIVDQKSSRFGRMLEIKNPVSRDITGIPKKEYWVQMQLQMEVCDLDECDFFETKFVEYPDSKSYCEDMNSDKKKGVIIQFYTKEGIPFYAYKPLHLNSDEEVLQWEDETITLYESEPYQYSYTRYIYWKLQQTSCVLVLRNREWFKNNIGQLGKVWKIVEEERVTGYEHRAPKSSSKKSETKYASKEEPSLFNFIRIVKKEQDK